MARWGMVIDLDRCTGCAGCVAACHQENNMTAVGAEQSLGHDRAFNWLHMLREDSGTYPDVKVRFLPQPCFFKALIARRGRRFDPVLFSSLI